MADIYDRILTTSPAAPESCGSAIRSIRPLRSARRSPGRQLDRILDYIESGKQEGAKLLCGGEHDTDDEKAKGFFVKPTVFSEVTPEMRIAREEVFGPVLCAIPFSDPDEALRIANATVYGLAASVWTADLKLAHRMAAGIRAGSVWINTYNTFDSASPSAATSKAVSEATWGRRHWNSTPT